MKKQMHRLLSFVLSLILVVGMIPGTMTAYAAGTESLTWNNETFTSTQGFASGGNDTLELTLVGDNKITISRNTIADHGGGECGLGVDHDNLIIGGTGTLTIKMNMTGVGNYVSLHGLSASNIVIKDSAKVIIEVAGSDSGNHGISCSTISVEDNASIDITVTGNKQYETNGISAYQWASFTSKAESNITVYAKPDSLDAPVGYGVYVDPIHADREGNGNITVKNGSLNVTMHNPDRLLGTIGSALCSNGYKLNKNGVIHIENATVVTTIGDTNAINKKAAIASEAFTGGTITDSIIIKNSNVTVNGMQGGGIRSDNYGVLIEDSNVKVTSSYAPGGEKSGSGIWAKERLIINGNSDVSVTTNNYEPILVNGNVKINLSEGGKLTVEDKARDTFEFRYVRLGVNNVVTQGTSEIQPGDLVNITAADNKFVVEYQNLLTGTVFYTSGTNVGKMVTTARSGDIASLSNDVLNYQWQISSNGTSGWSDINGATGSTYTIPAEESYVGKYIRVVVTADGYLGEVASPAQEITKRNNMTEVPETPALTKNTEGTAITIANYQADQEYVVSTSATPNWETDQHFSSATLSGLTTNQTYYVHTRMAETAEKQAGYVVRSSNISLAASIYLSGIDVVAEKYVAASGEVVKITVNPVPGNATGFDGAKWYLNYGAGAKLYTDANCTTEITYSNTYYTTVYLKGTDAETVTISAERSAGSGAPYMDNVKVEIAGSNGAFAFGANEIKLTPNSITIPQGGTAIVELSSMVTSEKPIDTAIWAYSHNTDLNGLTFEHIEGTNQFLVKASSDCTVGTGGYKVTVNGTTQTNTLSVTVTGDAIPAESISIVPVAITLTIADTYDLTAVIAPANATNATVTWSSNNEGVATVTNGKVTAVAEGTATITATVNGKSATCSVAVFKKEVTATVSDVTVKGTVGTSINLEEFAIDVSEDTFEMSIPSNITDWFTNIPAGLTVTKIDSSGLRLIVRVTGTPTAASDEAMEIVIPAEYLTSSTTDVTVTTNANAKYSIVAGSITPPTEYDITVTGGTASVGAGTAVTKATAGTVITLTVDESAIPAGKVFDKWEVVSGGVTVADGKFTMPANAVEIRATYKDAPVIPTEYNITVTGGTASANKAVAGTVITLTVDESAIPAGKVFDKWEVVSGGVTVADGKFTMPANAVEINATYKDAPVSHTCDIKPVAKDEPSCTEGGKEAYYKCEGCGKFYEDALGAKEITDLANWGNLPKLGHTESDWKSDKDNHWKECTVTACGVIIEDSKAAHKDDNKDGKCDVCEYNVGTPGGDKPNDNPQTGDNSNMFLWIALLFISGAGVVATTVFGKKKFSVK